MKLKMDSKSILKEIGLAVAKEAAKKIGEPYLLSLLEPNEIRFKKKNNEGIDPVNDLLETTKTNIQELNPDLPRNSVLRGCLYYTEELSEEELIIGYGKKQGQGTNIYSLQHFSGERGKVGFPDHAMLGIKEYVRSGKNNEVIVYHNHPFNMLRGFLDNLPLASLADRRILKTQIFDSPELFIKDLFNLGTIKFYVEENGFVKEFTLPSIIENWRKIKPFFQF